MLLLLSPIAAGALVGRAHGGTLTGLRSLRLRGRAMVFLGLGIQAVLGRVPGPARSPLVLATFALAGVWIALNLAAKRRWVRYALVLMAAGWALNVVAIAPNGGMPVSRDGLDAVGAPPHLDVADGHLFKHVGGDESELSRWLGDTIPIRPLRAVVSVGDLALVLGIGLLIASAMRGDAPQVLHQKPVEVVGSVLGNPVSHSW